MRPNNNIITAQDKMVIEMRYQNIYESIWSTSRDIGIKFVKNGSGTLRLTPKN